MTATPEALLVSSATGLARLIRSGEVSSREVVEAHIARIERVNPRLNAVVRDRFDEAREEARRADEAVGRAGAGDRLPPLLGVPCTVKEAFALEGMPNTAGLVSRRGTVARSDATAVRRLRQAGAIPLGVTNVSELCMWMEAHNAVYGRTCCAYDRSRTSGGSSGGEGAIVGAGGSPFGLGSDIGGSIRLPAFFNGVFGHKPTGGLVPGSGQFPIASGAALRYLTTGPLCRRAEDLWPLLGVLAGPDGLDEGCRPFALGEPGRVGLDGLEVLSVPDDGVVPVCRDLREAQVRVEGHLRSRGARVVRRRLPGLRRSLQVWAAMLGAAGGPSYAELLGGGQSISVVPEALRFALGRSPFTLPSLGLAALEALQKLAPSRLDRFVAEGRALRAELVDAVGEGVMLYPPYPELAPRHRAPLLGPFRWVYTAVMNVLEVPATSVPLGLGRAGLPLGVQVVAAHGADHRSVAVALELEEAFGGWVPPARGAARRPPAARQVAQSG